MIFESLMRSKTAASQLRRVSRSIEDTSRSDLFCQPVKSLIKTEFALKQVIFFLSGVMWSRREQAVSYLL